MNRDEYTKRTRAILNPDLTRDEVFLIFGLGSGGARLAEEAALFGVGRMILVDRPGEVLEEHNIIRHTLGYACLGYPKVEGVRDRIHDRNPACSVETVELDVTTDNAAVRDLIEQATQVHICTDNEESKHVINEQCVERGATMTFAGVFDGGCGGEVGIVRPGTACYACHAAHLRRDARPRHQESYDYSDPRSFEQTTAALNVDIAQIALIQARVALLLTLAEPLDGNYILFGNRPVAGVFDRMLESAIWHVPRDPRCLVCGLTRTDKSCDQSASEIMARAVVRNA